VDNSIKSTGLREINDNKIPIYNVDKKKGNQAAFLKKNKRPELVKSYLKLD
jgi:hypothetical protein